MPELPEVETIRLQLNQVLPGLTIKNIKILSAKNFLGESKKVLGATITAVNRYGKLLVITLDNNYYLVIHLKLTGRLIYRGQKQPRFLTIGDPQLQTLPNQHTRVIVEFNNGDFLFFNDLRKFGWFKVSQNYQEEVSQLGIEPLTSNFTLANWQKVLKASAQPIKLVLMDQTKIAGVGNIYANEALFLAKIHPQKKANELIAEEALRLYQKIKQVLKQAIKYRGASDDDYLDAFGQKGEMQNHFFVYNQKNKPCPNQCGAVINKIKLGGRGTYFCPVCQSNP